MTLLKELAPSGALKHTHDNQMNKNIIIRQALACELGRPWRQIRVRAVRAAVAQWRFEVELDGRWRRSPQGWPDVIASRRLPGSAVEHAIRHRGQRPDCFASGMTGFDRCFGGALLRGTVAVIVGPPGAGKTALALSAAHELALRSSQVLYASSEEGVIAMSRKLAAMQKAPDGNLALTAASSWSAIEAEAVRLEPDVVFVDALNTVTHVPAPEGADHLDALVGAAVKLTRRGPWRPTVVLLAHDNRSETHSLDAMHRADAVLLLARQGDVVTLRTSKNRYGASDVEARYFFRGGRFHEATGTRRHPEPGSLAETVAPRAGSA